MAGSGDNGDVPTLASARSLEEIQTAMINKQATVKVISGFIMSGRKPTEPDEVITVSEAFARELITSNKAVRYEPPPEPASEPSSEPQADPTSSEPEKPSKALAPEADKPKASKAKA